MTCQRIGWLPIGTIGFGTRSEASRMRKPRPPQKRTTFISTPYSGGPGGDLREQPVHRELVRPDDEDLAVRDGRGDELRARIECVACAGLVAGVELLEHPVG